MTKRSTDAKPTTVDDLRRDIRRWLDTASPAQLRDMARRHAFPVSSPTAADMSMDQLRSMLGMSDPANEFDASATVHMARIDGMKLATLNVREHHFARSSRVKKQRSAAYTACLRDIGVTRPALPVVVTVTRIGPRGIDNHDNLPGSAKAIVDGIADYLDVDDRDKRVAWQYRQRKGAPKQYAVEVEITARRDR